MGKKKSNNRQLLPKNTGSNSSNTGGNKAGNNPTTASDTNAGNASQSTQNSSSSRGNNTNTNTNTSNSNSNSNNNTLTNARPQPHPHLQPQHLKQQEPSGSSRTMQPAPAHPLPAPESARQQHQNQPFQQHFGPHSHRQYFAAPPHAQPYPPPVQLQHQHQYQQHQGQPYFAAPLHPPLPSTSLSYRSMNPQPSFGLRPKRQVRSGPSNSWRQHYQQHRQSGISQASVDNTLQRSTTMNQSDNSVSTVATGNATGSGTGNNGQYQKQKQKLSQIPIRVSTTSSAAGTSSSCTVALFNSAPNLADLTTPITKKTTTTTTPAGLWDVYPPATKRVVDNISKTLQTSPEFYTRVVDLLYELGLASPFATTAPALTSPVPVAPVETTVPGLAISAGFDLAVTISPPPPPPPFSPPPSPVPPPPPPLTKSPSLSTTTVVAEGNNAPVTTQIDGGSSSSSMLPLKETIFSGNEGENLIVVNLKRKGPERESEKDGIDDSGNMNPGRAQEKNIQGCGHAPDEHESDNQGHLSSSSINHNKRLKLGQKGQEKTEKKRENNGGKDGEQDEEEGDEVKGEQQQEQTKQGVVAANVNKNDGNADDNQTKYCDHHHDN